MPTKTSTIEAKTEGLELLQEIFDSIPNGIILYDSKGEVVLLNKSVKLIFTKNLKPSINRKQVFANLKDFFKYEVEFKYNADDVFNKVIKDKQEFSNLFIISKEKPEKVVRVSAKPFGFNNPKTGNAASGALFHFEDVTHFINQQKKLQEKFLRTTQEKERWQAIFDNVEEGIFTTGKDLIIQRFNERCEQLSGFSKAEAIGQRYEYIFKCHNKHGPLTLELSPINKVILTKEAVPYDEHLQSTKDGREYWVGASYTPVLDKEGNVEECVVVIRDISRLKEIDQAKSEFVSIASHELRTPLTIINGYLDLLLTGQLGELGDPTKKEFHKNLINKIYKESKRLKSLVEELLNVSLIEEGKMRLRFQKVKVNQLVEEVVTEMNYLANAKNINLRSELRDDSLVMADPQKIKQVLTNLIDNSLKFTGNGGTIEIKGHKEDNHYFVEVIDSGVGIPKRLIPNLFEKFQQVSGSYLKENKGTGLGLFIVKGIVELHGGKIWIDSDLGQGTTVAFKLPLLANRE